MKHIYDYIAEYAQKNPEKTALADSFGSITYAQLDRQSGILAAMLKSVGVALGDSVGVYVPYVKEIALGGISAVRAGGIYMPMDDSYPEERLNFMLTDSKAKAILTVHSLWEKAPLDFPPDQVIFMDKIAELSPYTMPDLPMEADAFILYTSGTTGRPKGVVHSHRMMVSFLDWATIHEGTTLREDSRTAAMTGFTFVGSMGMLYAPLCKGASAYVVPETARKDIAALYSFICRMGITHMFMPSSLAATFVEYYDTGSLCIFAGGEKMRNFRAISPDTLLINSYGTTELEGVISVKVHGDETVIPTGYIAADTKYMIWDENGLPAADDEPGELLVTNNRMSRRYLNLPEQTAKHWVERDGELWFRTGDRVRRTADGVFTILGRTDNMVKLRGFRIETGEVEAQISRVISSIGAEVKNIAVVLITVNGIDHLACYYESPVELDTQAVTNGISASLTSYMVPDFWVRLDAMPRNSNGKIMRSQLPQPENYASAPGMVFSEAEARVVEIAASVLGIRNYISPDDGFEALGGTSIKAMEFVSELRKVGIDISSAEILKLETLRKIAAKAEIRYERFWSSDEYERIRTDFAARGEHIEKVLPLTPEQDEALFELLLHPDRPGSRRVFMLQVDSVITENELRQVLNTVSSEFEQLRASIVFHKVSVIQQVITDRRVPVQIIEYPEGNYTGLKELYHTLSRKYCDLQKESSVQIVCVNIGKESFLFVLDYMAGINMSAVRRYIARMMDVLSFIHPEDESIASWKDIFSLNLSSLSEKKDTQHINELLKLTSEKHRQEAEALHIYSDLPEKKKIIFVHTGNTGSEAYYRLAGRIRNDFSFAVLEPYNLYHPTEAKYGIGNIAARYVETLKKYQPDGPYILGGWCYGGMIAHEMACQLQAMGDRVEYLFLLDTHAILDERVRKEAEVMRSLADREYFETADLFKDMRQHGMLDALVENSRHVGYDIMTHIPSHYDGPCMYFKPKVIPAAAGGSRKYWNLMKDEYAAGGYENYCSRELLTVLETPHEHDLMMDKDSLDIIVPNIYQAIQPDKGES